MMPAGALDRHGGLTAAMTVVESACKLAEDVPRRAPGGDRVPQKGLHGITADAALRHQRAVLGGP